MTQRRITLYDTTLRDGAQGQGISFSDAGKLRLATRLDQFGIHYIEGGFPGSNPREMAFFRAVACESLTTARVVAFGSTRRARTRVQNDPLLLSLLAAGTRTATLYGKAWRFHVRRVLGTTERENRAMVSDSIRFLKDHGREVFFDAEHFFDGYKDAPDFALSVLRAAEEAGAEALVLCDTNGGSLPEEIHRITREVMAAVRTPVGIHCHNDSGMAVANTIEAVRAGASHVQGTMNGFGERCGNADLTTLIPTLQLKMGCACVAPSELAQLRELSLFADELVDLRHDDRAPYVGQSAFAHKGGAHVAAVRKAPRSFEHIEPAAVGNERHILMSELSGSSSVLWKAIELGAGHTKSKEEIREILKALKDLESRGYAFEAADASFRILIQKVLKEHKPFFDLLGFRVIVEKRGKDGPCLSEATIKVRVHDAIEQTVAEGDGPVNALDSALRKALVRFYPAIAKVVLQDFRVRILDPEEATAATTRVLIESGDGEETWGTVGVSENIIEASWEALVDSMEYKLFQEEARQRRRKKTPARGATASSER